MHKKAFGIQIKPIGNNCNLRCKYCYAAPFAKPKIKTIPLDILETAIRKTFEFQNDIFFTWHGGEPMVPGLDFYESVVEIMNKYKTPKHIVRNMIQTNATLITPEFADFFVKNNFIPSVSIDGPEYIHNKNRIKFGGDGSFDMVMAGVKNLRNVGMFTASNESDYT
jgi:uncharacterized protein